MAEEIKIITSNKKAYYDYHILEKYEADIKRPSTEIQGKTYPQLYDVKTQKQSEEYARLYEEVLNELIQMGGPFD